MNSIEKFIEKYPWTTRPVTVGYLIAFPFIVAYSVWYAGWEEIGENVRPYFDAHLKILKTGKPDE